VHPIHSKVSKRRIKEASDRRGGNAREAIPERRIKTTIFHCELTRLKVIVSLIR